MDVLARGLVAPWAVAFLDGATILVTERPGTLEVLRRGRLTRAGLALSVAKVGDGGLLGLAVDPEYPRTRFVYLYYTHRGRMIENRVSRFVVSDDGRRVQLDDEQVLVTGIPAGVFGNGGRIAFGPDKLLYVSTGDAGRPELAARPRSLAGKILRLRPDGAVPRDNPFPGSYVWAYGLRNVQGLAWDATGRLYASEHGPSGEFNLCCHDEINRIEPGRFYGWPFLAGNARAARAVGPAAQLRRSSVAPIVESGSTATWTPSGMAFAGRSLYVATLRGEQLRRFDFLGRSADKIRQPPLLRGYGRLRDVIRGPDGCLYVITSNRDGHGTPKPGDDRLLRRC